MKTAGWAGKSCPAARVTARLTGRPADLTADLYEMAVERLAALGLARYEISNFARPGHESRHNLKYWLLEPYAGFGATPIPSMAGSVGRTPNP